MMQLRIRHETLYRYDEPVSYSIQSLKLTPRPDPGQRVLSWRIQSPGERMEQIDPYGNVTHLVTVEVPHREMRIVVEGVAEIGPTQSEGMPEESQLSPLAYLAPTSLTRADAAIRRLAERCFGLHPAAPETLADLMREVCTAVRYQPGTTDVHHSAAEAIDFGEGVCQDQAHVFIAACRSANIPARYVSGYFYPGETAPVASHAWVDVWLAPERRWHSLDVTHAIAAGEHYCRLAVGRDYLDAAPVRGVRRGGGREQLEVSVSVVPGTAQQ
jgi:transglutaminase-like putative cysteine protease